MVSITVRSILFLAVFAVSNALDCVQIPDNKIVAGKRVTIPDGAKGPVEIPPNYSCTYNVKVPPMVYAHVTLENGLKGNNDRITVRDAQGIRTLVSGRSSPEMSFYVFPNTTTTFQLVTKSVNVNSKFQMQIFYGQVKPSDVTKLGNDNYVYFFWNDVKTNSYMSPQTVTADEQIQVTFARSGWDGEYNDNNFIVDGDLQNPNSRVYRLTQLGKNYISRNKTVTILGLDNRVSESSAIFTPLSQVQKYEEFLAVDTYFGAEQSQIKSSSMAKPSILNVISISNGTTILSVSSYCGTGGSLKAVSSFDHSEVYLDIESIVSYPRNITHRSFCVLATNCEATFNLVSY